MSEIKEARLQKANSLVSKGFASYAQSFKVSNTIKFLFQKFDYLENGQEEDFSVSIAGRVMAKRVMGKIAFFTISDQEGGKVFRRIMKSNMLPSTDISLKTLFFGGFLTGFAHFW